MFFRLIALFAVLAVAFANPKPEPQVLSYAAAVPAYPYAAAAGYANVATGYTPYVAAGYPYGYSAYYVR